MCRNEEWAFTDYKEAKIKAAKGRCGEYRKGKVSNSKPLIMQVEKYNQK